MTIKEEVSTFRKSGVKTYWVIEKHLSKEKNPDNLNPQAIEILDIEYVQVVKLKDFKKILKVTEGLMDESNSKYGEKGNLCIYCNSKNYDEQGIIHTKWCVIPKLRRMIK